MVNLSEVKSDEQVIAECIERIRQSWKPYTSNELRMAKYRYYKRIKDKKGKKNKNKKR